MDSKERENEGRAINNLVFSEKRGGKYYTFLKFTRKEKIRTEIKKGDLCLLTINDGFVEILFDFCKNFLIILFFYIFALILLKTF
ncbi:MAG: hypothetical protein PUD86_06140 [Methanobacteriaceae archaeon]|nr:hypothetical protein [Methanobacteriaceae archaeon]